MKLDSVDGQLPVAQAHDLALCRFGADFEAVGEGFAPHQKRMVAGGFKGGGEVCEDSLAVVQDGGGFAVHEAAGADDLSAKDVADALVPEADAEEGHTRPEGADDLVGDPGFLRGTGTRGDADAFGLERFDLGEGDLVVAFDGDLSAQFAEVLHQVVGEGVVVIDDEQHRIPEVRG